MERKQKEPFILKNPFSDEFMIAWNYWKKFKKEQFRFTYKPIGEQNAINGLYEISDGDEQTAKLIIKQSLRNCWSGLFPLKTFGHGQNKKQTINETAATRKSINDLYNERFGGRR